jgi:hypothetical protein
VQEEDDFGGIGVSFGKGEEIQVIVADVEILVVGDVSCAALSIAKTRSPMLTLMPSWEKQGGTADDSSSASESRTGNCSTADMGMSPR